MSQPAKSSPLLRYLWMALGVFCVVAIVACGDGPSGDEYGRWTKGGAVMFSRWPIDGALYAALSGVFVGVASFWLHHWKSGKSIPSRQGWAITLTVVFALALVLLLWLAGANFFRWVNHDPFAESDDGVPGLGWVILLIIVGTCVIVVSFSRLLVDEFKAKSRSNTKAVWSFIAMLGVIYVFSAVALPSNYCLGSAGFPVVTEEELDELPWYTISAHFDFQDDSLHERLDDFPFLFFTHFGPASPWIEEFDANQSSEPSEGGE